MPRKRTPPESSPEKKVYGLRLQSFGPAAGFHFNLPENHRLAEGCTSLTLEDLVRRTAQRSGTSEETSWKVMGALTEMFGKLITGLGKPLSPEEGIMLLTLYTLGVRMSRRDMRDLIRQIRTGPVDRFFPLEEVFVH